MTLPEIEALSNLAAQLGDQQQDSRMCSAEKLAWEDRDGDGCDFSSFPSLSLEESPGNYHTGVFSSRDDVESHVESLLSRPILLGKQDEEDFDPEGDSLDEFFVNSLDEVPGLMSSNFCRSFSTLMNSRLRAYSTFLARHALSVARYSKTDQDMEGVAGIEHKLETMLAIGKQVSTGTVSSKFAVDQAKSPEPLPLHGDDEAVQVSLPLMMETSLNILLPHVKEADGDELMNVSFQTSGNICGIFARSAERGDEPPLLRVVEVSLDMHQLLTAMAEEASKVISCIVEMTNVAYGTPSAALESPLKFASVDGANASHCKRKATEADDDAIVALSPEKCATIVDYIIGELDDELLSQATTKKLKVFH